MKLFAKRTKKVTSSPPKERTVFQSDPVCEELLKQDPATWNAKQRRMIKRYQDRKMESSANIDTELNEEVETPNEKESVVEQKLGAESSVDSESSKDDDDEEEEEEDEEEKKKSEAIDATEDEDDKSHKQDQANNETPDADKGEFEQQQSKGDDQSKAVTDLNAILERLDSKNRRKLRRKLDRGESSEEEIRKEALTILDPPQEDATLKGDAKGEKRAAEDTTPKGKKRAKVDWSTLTPAERMRREEQRRIQQEVAAKRAAGEVSSNRHPLNSERRRANRRKPKWEKKSHVTNDHHASGFEMRKSKTAA